MDTTSAAVTAAVVAVLAAIAGGISTVVMALSKSRRGEDRDAVRHWRHIAERWEGVAKEEASVSDRLWQRLVSADVWVERLYGWAERAGDWMRRANATMKKAGLDCGDPPGQPPPLEHPFSTGADFDRRTAQQSKQLVSDLAARTRPPE